VEKERPPIRRAIWDGKKIGKGRKREVGGAEKKGIKPVTTPFDLGSIRSQQQQGGLAQQIGEGVSTGGGVGRQVLCSFPGGGRSVVRKGRSYFRFLK